MLAYICHYCAVASGAVGQAAHKVVYFSFVLWNIIRDRSVIAASRENATNIPQPRKRRFETKMAARVKQQALKH